MSYPFENTAHEYTTEKFYQHLDRIRDTYDGCAVTRYFMVVYLTGYYGIFTPEMLHDVNEAYLKGEIKL